ncbi:hypothetical protein N7541_004217 [Penicillium brevicompactum]|uniref:BTB domain-containing protein n=1 Tax=Penicillium brevicompactum TaxID=5074 RepID=A0A9W9RT82_PENBR|nr:hypothetical protein N7541_004217 [Penicillium brevicompactum]
MSDEAPETGPRHFVKEFLPLFEGPYVKIRLVPSEEEYKVSKALICARWPVFSAMFNGRFRESEEQEVELEEMEQVVSVRSVEALIQWLYQGTVCFNMKSNSENISAVIELARLGDRYNIFDLENKTADYIRTKITDYRGSPSDNSHTWCLERDHIASATALPRGHLVREVLAQASVKGYIRRPTYKFAEEAQIYPTYGADLLHEVSVTLENIACMPGQYLDPIDGGVIHMRFQHSR